MSGIPEEAHVWLEEGKKGKEGQLYDKYANDGLASWGVVSPRGSVRALTFFSEWGRSLRERCRYRCRYRYLSTDSCVLTLFCEWESNTAIISAVCQTDLVLRNSFRLAPVLSNSSHLSEHFLTSRHTSSISLHLSCNESLFLLRTVVGYHDLSTR